MKYLTSSQCLESNVTFISIQMIPEYFIFNVEKVVICERSGF